MRRQRREARGRGDRLTVRERVRVVVVDDQYMARGFFEGLVRMSERYALAASLCTAEQAIAFCLEHPVDLVIMDVMMKYGLDGLTCARSIKANHPEVKIILTTSTAEAEWIGKARRAKVESFWFKEYSAVSLTEVMDRTMAGESVYPDSPPNPDFGDAEKTDLSDRELEVLRELTRNLTNEEIAEKLHISPHTVNPHPAHAGKDRIQESGRPGGERQDSGAGGPRGRPHRKQTTQRRRQSMKRTMRSRTKNGWTPWATAGANGRSEKRLPARRTAPATTPAPAAKNPRRRL